MTLDKPTKMAIEASDIRKDLGQIEDTHNDNNDSIWIDQGTTVSNTQIKRVKECEILRLVRIDVHDGNQKMLCDIVR